MTKNTLRFFLFILLIFFFFNGCNTPTQHLPVLATVGNKKIYLNEFRDRINYTPDIKFKTSEKIKLWGINSLIAEKLLSILADKHSDKNLQPFLKQQNREAVIESLWKNIILSKIEIPDSIIWNYYIRKNHHRIVKFIIAEDSILAQKIYNLWKKGDVNIDRQALVDTIAYALNNALNKTIYNLPLNTVHRPLKIADSYLLIKPLRDYQKKILSRSDYNQTFKSLKKEYLENIKLERLKKYTKEYFKQQPYLLDKKVFGEFVRFLNKKLFSKNKSPIKSIKNLEFKSLQNEPQWTRPVVRFRNGETWSVKKLFDRLKVSPYQVGLKTEVQFRYSIIKAVRRILDDEMFYKQALKQGQGKTPYVLWQNSMWADNLKANTLLRSKRLNKGQWIKKLDSLKSTIDIKVNWMMLDSLKINPTRMMVLKKNFPGRTLVPVLRSWWLNIKQ